MFKTFDATVNLKNCQQLTDFPVRLPDGPRPRTAVLRFGATRGRILAVSFAGQVVTGQVAEQRAFRFQIPAEAKDADLAKVHVQWQGDPPVPMDPLFDPQVEVLEF